VLEVNGTRHPLEPPGLVIGRGTEADLRINDPGISRLHAQIRVRASGPSISVDIVDLGSTNGIVVNGHKVAEAVLQEGSRIEIGSTRMLVHAPAGR
jgi:pSer/pThr/pTyr-binding forkhead associated (FHA) protein